MLQQIGAFLVIAAVTAFPALADLPVEAAGPLKAGDLLFKGATTGAGTRLAADWSNGDKRWGHIGIVVMGEDGVLQVIHADTGKPGETGAVRRVSLAGFLSDVTDLGVYETDLSGPALTVYLNYAESVVGRPFDHGFSLADDDSLYCSELVWRALSAGLGADAVPEKSRRLGRTYVSVSDISDNPHAHEARTIKGGSAGH